MDELILCVAPYPGEAQDEKCEGRLDVPDEVLRSFDEGASIVHLHVRDEKGNQTTDATVFRRDVEKIRSRSPVIIEGSTGGAPEHTLEQRSVSVTIPGIEMGSLNLGSVNMNGSVYRNPMSDIRFYAREMHQRRIKPFLCVFDLSMFYNVERLEEEGLISPSFVYNFVFGIPDAIPFVPRYLDIFLGQLPKGAHWFLTLHGGLRGWEDFVEVLERGGHVRVGFEDSPFLSGGKRARSNAELVREVAEAAGRIGRKIVGPDRAREILGLRSSPSKPLRG
jgi:3-keto-5-aminohexanoate cleavage enzyme